MREDHKKVTNSKPIPHIPLPFTEVIADVLKVKPPITAGKKHKQNKQKQKNQTS